MNFTEFSRNVTEQCGYNETTLERTSCQLNIKIKTEKLKADLVEANNIIESKMRENGELLDELQLKNEEINDKNEEIKKLKKKIEYFTQF